MKKLIICILAILIIIGLAGCAMRICSDCGKITPNGYTAYGRYFCEPCFRDFMF